MGDPYTQCVAEFEVTEEQAHSSHGGRVVLDFPHGAMTVDGTRFLKAGKYELRRVHDDE